jgi:hypothetical protein
MLMDEIDPPTFLHIPQPTDEFLQRKRTDGDFIESHRALEQTI